MYPNPTKMFTKIFREKAHPEAKTEKELEAIRKLQFAFHDNLTKQIKQLQNQIQALAEKVNIILDIKNLKEKIDKLSF